MAINPDSKDWTWVLERTCPECGFDAASVHPADVARMIRENASSWEPILNRFDVRDRPSDDRWSPLEYGCHVRDVYRIYDERLQMMIQTDDPQFPNWDQDATAVQQGYYEQDPNTVIGELATAASALAARFDTVRSEDWSRTGTRSDGANFTIASFSRYLIHDPIHHLWDVS